MHESSMSSTMVEPIESGVESFATVECNIHDIPIIDDGLVDWEIEYAKKFPDEYGRMTQSSKQAKV